MAYRNTEKIRLRRICDSGEKFKKHIAEYQNYSTLGITSQVKWKEKFSDIKKLTREEARKPKLLKATFPTSCNLINQYNLLLPNLKTIIRKHLPILYKYLFCVNAWYFSKKNHKYTKEIHNIKKK